MKKAALSIVLALLIASPALARAHQHRNTNVGTHRYVDPHHSAPTYSNDVPFAPF